MARVRDLSKAQLAFQIAEGEVADFLVTRFRGSEGLSQLYRFELELVSEQPRIAFHEVVGKRAALTINSEDGTRYFHGVVARFELIGHTVDQTYYRVELVPAVWLLTHRYGCRIFQDKSVQEIITQVLTDGGISADQFRFQLEGSYEPREYCVQYRETDYNFICRLMEEEGMRWWFEQTTDKHVMAISDTATYEPMGDEADIPFISPTAMNPSVEHVSRFRIGQAVRPGATALNDFNFLNPKLDLKAKCDVGRDTGLEFFDYPGEYIAQAEGTRYAKLRVEEFEAGRTVGVGVSNCHRLAVGTTFNLVEHPIEGLNATYMVTTILHEGRQSTERSVEGGNGRGDVLTARVHQALITAQRHADPAVTQLAAGLMEIAQKLGAGDPTARRDLTTWLYHAGQVARDLPSVASAQGGRAADPLAIPNLIDDLARLVELDTNAPTYRCRFECIPEMIPYRPARLTPWPVMRGTQTARVVGPSGEEIYCDEFGRVKVQFNWDREGKFDEKSSCWIRVSQGMAGGGYGIMFLPRIGQEVVVDFLEGDPDRPLIVGRVYNADHMPPYPLPDEKSKSVIKTNSSPKGGGTNEIRFDDAKDKEQLLFYAQKDMHIHVVNDLVENVDHQKHLTVKENAFALYKQNCNLEVKLDANEKVGGKKSLKVVGDSGTEVDGSASIKTGTKFYVNAGTEMVLEAGTAITVKCGGNFVKVDSSGVTIVGTQVLINSGGSAGSATEVALVAPEAPLVADTVQPGKDTTYAGGDALAVREAEPDLAQQQGEEEEEKKTSWIEIELVDEEGQPWPNEEYEIKAPDGETIHRGRLDSRGMAHVQLKEPGTCQICFPNLDAAAWERLG